MGGSYDSSRTRVTPVFDALLGKEDWLSRLLTLPLAGFPDADRPDVTDSAPEEVAYGAKGLIGSPRTAPEARLPAPPEILRWLVANVVEPEGWASPANVIERRTTAHFRQGLIKRDRATIRKALDLLDAGRISRGWHVLEGPTAPDVFIKTPSTIVVIEGKRTERGPTTYTEWMRGRHQMWRHIDAAWGIRGERKVVGFFIVEANEGVAVPDRWLRAAQQTWSDDTVKGSLPHRSEKERARIRRCFLGITTWQQVVDEFGLGQHILRN